MECGPHVSEDPGRVKGGGRRPGAGGMDGCRAGIMGDGDLGVGSRWVRVCASVLAERYRLLLA